MFYIYLTIDEATLPSSITVCLNQESVCKTFHLIKLAFWSLKVLNLQRIQTMHTQWYCLRVKSLSPPGGGTRTKSVYTCWAGGFCPQPLLGQIFGRKWTLFRAIFSKIDVFEQIFSNALSQRTKTLV